MGEFKEYDRSKEVKEQLRQCRDTTLKEFVAMGTPFFIAVAASNKDGKTHYEYEASTPKPMTLELYEDHFPDFINILHHGFRCVLDINSINENAKALDKGDKLMDRKKVMQSFDPEDFPDLDFSQEEDDDTDDHLAVIDTAAKQGERQIRSVASRLADEPDAGPEKELDDSLLPEPGPAAPEDISSNELVADFFTGCQDGILVLDWGATDTSGISYEKAFREIDEQHRNILKGNGDFIREKENAMYEA